MVSLYVHSWLTMHCHTNMLLLRFEVWNLKLTQQKLELANQKAAERRWISLYKSNKSVWDVASYLEKKCGQDLVASVNIFFLYDFLFWKILIYYNFFVHFSSFALIMTNNVSKEDFADCQQALDLCPVESLIEMCWDGSLASWRRSWKFWKQQRRDDGCDVFHYILRYKN